MEEKQFTIIITAENVPGILNRVTNLFTRRKVNIESMTAAELAHEGISKITVGVVCERSTLLKIVKQLERIIEVIEVKGYAEEEILFKEIAWIKVPFNETTQNKIIELINRYNANIIHLAKDAIIIEETATEEQTNRLVDELKPLGILDINRSGRIAISKK